MKKPTPKKSETRSVPVGLRFTPTLKDALDLAARDDHRPLASLIEKILTEWLREKGFLTK
jgi:hypothetical protein